MVDRVPLTEEEYQASLAARKKLYAREAEEREALFGKNKRKTKKKEK